jgi:hypothetical protein
VRLIIFLVGGDIRTIDGYLRSPIGSRSAPIVVPFFYRKLFAKKSEKLIAREVWRHVLKRALRNMAAPLRVSFVKSCGLVATSIYRYFLPNGHFPDGAYIFSDLERLPEEGLTEAKALCAMITGSKSAVRILNDPASAMRRYELLRTLYDQGINDFNVYWANGGTLPGKFPVFLRYENEHSGAISPLLNNAQELSDAIKDLKEGGGFSDHVLIVEFSNTVDENGVYRKYGAFVVGDRIFPKNINSSKCWVTKSASLPDPELLAKEREYVTSNPHHDLLRNIFSLGRIDFGRIDYSMVDGNIRVWEINTNPTISTPSLETRMGVRKPVYDLLELEMSSALESLLKDRG